MTITTTQLLYELIENMGISSASSIHTVVRKLTERDINLLLEQVQGIYQSMDDDIETIKRSELTFKVVPSGHLNIVSPMSCDAFECKKVALESACKRLILYTDIISMNDLLLPALNSILKGGLTYSNIEDLVSALKLLLMIKPLSDAGMLFLSPDIGNWILCDECVKMLANEARIDINKACDIFLKDNKVSLHRDLDKEYSACFHFFDSGDHNLWYPLDEIDIDPSLRSKIKNKDKDGNFFYDLPVKEAKNLIVTRSKVAKICLHLNWAATLAEKLEGALVTDSFSEWDLLRQNANLRGLTPIENDIEIPFIENIGIADLIAVRKNEPISFEKLRLSFSNLKKEFSIEKHLSKNELSYYIKNRISSELKIIDEDLRKLRSRTFVESVATSAIACIFASIGFYEGAYSPILFNAIQQIGLLGIAFKGVHLCSEYLKMKGEIKSRASYFLWKAMKRKQ